MRILRVFTIVLAVAASQGVRTEGTPAPNKPIIIDGDYLKAVAHADFRAIEDLPDDKKRLERYSIRFDGNRTQISVSFIPKFPPGWFGAGGETPYGREVTYSTRRKTAAIDKRQFGE